MVAVTLSRLFLDANVLISALRGPVLRSSMSSTRPPVGFLPLGWGGIPPGGGPGGGPCLAPAGGPPGMPCMHERILHPPGIASHW